MSTSTTNIQRVAHRGGAHLAPENTLVAFRNALTLPVDAIELDVQISRDGYVMVFHDETMERLTDGKGTLRDLDFAYLRSLNAAAHFPRGWPEPLQIPTLQEVLALAKSRVQVYLEIKTSEGDHLTSYNIAKAIVQELRAAEMLQQVLVISLDWSVLAHVKAVEPLLSTGVVVSTESWSSYGEHPAEILVEQVKALGCDWIDLCEDLCTDDLPRYFHEHGLKVGLWTVNTLEAMRHFCTIGADALTSDRPDLFAQL